MTQRIVVASADVRVRASFRPLLEALPARVITARSLDLLLRRLEHSGADVVLLDLRLPGAAGTESLLVLRDRFPRIPVAVLARPAEQRAGAEALLAGAHELLAIPAQPHEIHGRLGRLLGPGPLAHRIGRLEATAIISDGRRELVSLSPAMREAAGVLRRLASTRSTVLLLGESGAGKELFARAIHFNSPRRQGPWIPLNCSAIPESIIESELFGHEKGAFTGAVSRTRGKFELAHGGTIFLDEISEMTPPLQAKLLRVLEEREVVRVGGSRPIAVDVRLLAATNANLEERMRRGAFREDLYWRLNVVALRVPPLRERREDLPVLVKRFLDEAAAANDAGPRRLHPDALRLLLRYPWPGNVRELKNVMESLVLTVPGAEIGADCLPARIRRQDGVAESAADGCLRAGMRIREAERELIRLTLSDTGGNRSRAAGLLGIGVRTLQRKIRTYGL